MITVADMISFLATQLDTAVAGSLEQRIRNAVFGAWARLMSLHKWAYFHRTGVLRVYPGQKTGACSYSLTTNRVTLTGAVWPTNAEQRHILLDRTWYPIARRVSDTVIQLSGQGPAADLTDVAYNIQQVLYPLPSEVSDIMVVYEAKQNVRMWRVSPTTAFQIQEGFSWSPTLPTVYSIVAAAGNPGKWMFWIPCEIFQTTELAYMYYARRPATVLYRESRGTVTISGGVATLSSPVATAAWLGACLRVGVGPESIPVGTYGDYTNDPSVVEPASTEVLVTEVLSATQVRISDAALAASGVGYTASSHIDVGGGCMETLLLRLCEDQYGTRPVAGHAERMVSQSQLGRSLQEAMAEDGRSTMNMRDELRYWYNLQLKDVAYVVS